MRQASGPFGQPKVTGVPDAVPHSVKKGGGVFWQAVAAPPDTHRSARAAPPFAGASVSAPVRAAVQRRSEHPCPRPGSAPHSPSPA